MQVDPPPRTLYTYWRSSAAYRVRIALNLKGLTYEALPINLLAHEHWDTLYGAMNPQKLVPTFLDGALSSDFLSQSLAIIEYLNEKYPNPLLLPKTIEQRAFVRQLACIIVCDVHPLHTPRVREYLSDEFDAGNAAVESWCRTWVYRGFDAYEALLEHNSPNSRYSCSDALPTIADCCLIPQVYSAKRLKCDMKSYPRINRVYEACMQMNEFKTASPEPQPDAVLQN